MWKVSKHVPTWEHLTRGPLCLPNNHDFSIMLGFPLYSLQTGENLGRGGPRISSFDGELHIFWREESIQRGGVSRRGTPLKNFGQSVEGREDAPVEKLPLPLSSSLCPSGITALYFWSSCSQA